jgi:hypothetical protein
MELLKSIGAVHVCDSSSPSFMADLIDALSVTSATMAFDATGGGKLVSYILTAMEAAANTSAREYSTIRVNRPQAGVHLWGSRSQPHHVDAEFWLSRGALADGYSRRSWEALNRKHSAGCARESSPD